MAFGAASVLANSDSSESMSTEVEVACGSKTSATSSSMFVVAVNRYLARLAPKGSDLEHRLDGGLL